jgi:hypothetical protein
VARARSTLVAFNTVERLFNGDFFHWVTADDVRAELAPLPGHWPVIGLGTTNWQERHGEVLVDGTAAEPEFTWADPEADPPAAVVPLDGGAHMPFVAVAACDPDGPAHTWTLGPGDDVHAAVAARCRAANIGLAALRVAGELVDVRFQVMCHLPVGGVTDDDVPVAKQERSEQDRWDVLGVYAANPTIQSVVSHGVAAVHLHGRAGDPVQGGHVNAAVATATTTVEVRPLSDLTVRILGLDVAVRPTTAR